MRILEINKFYYPRRGAERHFLDLIDLLRQQGHQVAVFTMDDARNVARAYEQYFVSPVGYTDGEATLWQQVKGIGRLFWSFEARRKLAALLDEYRPDVVHIHNIYHQLSLSILPIIKQRGIPIVMTAHDYQSVSPDKDRYYESVGQAYWKFLFVKKYAFGKRLLLVLKMYWERCFRFYEQSVDRYIAPSEFCKNILIQGGVVPEKITVLPHFIPAVSVRPLPDVAPESRGYALYFGAVSAEKGVTELVRMFDHLRYPLIVAGSSEEGFVLPESKWVRSVGQQSQDALHRLIDEAAFVVSGSLLPETFGLIILEAFSRGKPFFGLHAGAFAEIVTNGKNGYIAQDWAALDAHIREYLDRKICLSDAATIQRQALERFGALGYYRRLGPLFEARF